jgi:RNA 3'-terminal phosphate cyclase (ATP)
MLQIDGSQGEGGGQVLRTALAMSLVTRTPFQMVNIRAKRPKSGLRRQHALAVQAAAQVGRGRVQGGEIGAQALVFEPGEVTPGEYHFAVGSAGSTTLVLQTILPALLRAAGPSKLILEGGTHNPMAPPFEFLQRAFLPVVERMGFKVRATLERPGFYPAGGGKMIVEIQPTASPKRLDVAARGPVRRCMAIATVSALPRHIAERELAEVRRQLGWEEEYCLIEEVPDPRGPGNVLTLVVESEEVTEVFAGFGERGVRAEQVAAKLAREVKRYLAADVPVGEHLADQLMLPMVVAGGGSFRTLPLSLHATTNLWVIEQFRLVPAAVEDAGAEGCVVRFGGC